MISKTKKFSVFEPLCTAAAARAPADSCWDDAESDAMFGEIFDDISTERSKDASLADRKAMGMDADTTLTYGEIDSAAPVRKLLVRLRDEFGIAALQTRDDYTSADATFYDLGSGSGRPVVAAALELRGCGRWRCTGVELLPGLLQLSLEAQLRYDAVIADKCRAEGGGGDAGGAGCAPSAPSAPSVEFHLGSLYDLDTCDWSQGDIVFANSTCFDADMMLRLHRLTGVMKKGSVLISLSTPMDDQERLVKMCNLLPPTARARAEARAAAQEDRKQVGNGQGGQGVGQGGQGGGQGGHPAKPMWRQLFESREEMSWGCADYFVHIKDN